ncbi:hypothetical protein BDK92_4681 [Micromonospora pisi]|uniref:Dolichyl-phosphate-mannose-protein mannosyltransferase n=1 Tax=Micromonospora pisi TaxID=589240 RepID=A0A495JNB7_9ACTN|nr:hypothetical protein [Micromonospora pisi]RKR90311.1 hypothetical protein BDK92_4681 [Micromonospora pisi]
MAPETSSPERLTGDTVIIGRTEPEPTRQPTRWKINAPRVLLGFALLIIVVAPVALAVISGSISIPHNDAWSYSRIAQEFGRTGEIHLLGWNRSALVGQIVVLGPLAASITAQQIFVALLAGVAVLACYDLLAPSIGRLPASVAALVLAVWPELGLLGTSFMSDVPALAATLGCLALGRRALTGSSLPLLAGALTVGLWGVAIREQVLAAPVAVLLAALTSSPTPVRRGALSWRWSVLALGAAFGAGLLAFEWWRRSLAGDDPPAPLPDGPVLPDVLDVGVRGYFLLAIAVAPAVLAVARPWRWSPAALLVAAGTGALALLVWHDYHLSGFLMSDYLLPSGPYPAVFRGERSMIGESVLRVLVLLAMVSGVLLAGLVVERGRRLPPLLRWFTLFTVGGLLATRAAGQTVFGRYLIVLVPVLLLIVLARREEPSGSPERAESSGAGDRVRRGFPLGRAGVLAGIAAGTFLAALSLFVTAYGSALDAARWHAGERLVAEGVPAAEIDAGFEWSGYYSPDGVEYAPKGAVLLNWYSTKFARNPPCFAVASSAQSEPNWRLVRTVDYREYVVAGNARLWVYETGHCAPR